MHSRVNKYINYTIALMLVMSLMGVTFSSFILWFVLPRGMGLYGFPFCRLWGTGLAGNAYNVLSVPRYVWVDLTFPPKTVSSRLRVLRYNKKTEEDS